MVKNYPMQSETIRNTNACTADDNMLNDLEDTLISVSATRPALRPCPQCNGTIVQIIHEARYVLTDEHPLAPLVSVVTCSRCGFCFNDTPNKRIDYDRYYREFSKYADAKLSSGAGVNPEDNLRLTDTAKYIFDIAGPTEGAILDIGCGVGGLLDALKGVGYPRRYGMDPAPACAAAVAERGHHGIVGTLDYHPLSQGMFDGIILSHVLEHVRDVRSALNSVRQLLSEKGWLYVEVPDAMRYAECLVAPFQDFNLEHINHFTLTSLGNVLRVNGWKVMSDGLKWFPLPGGNRYPAIYSLVRPDAASSVDADFTGQVGLEEYVRKSTSIMRTIEHGLEQSTGGREIAVWGVGQLTMRLLGCSGLDASRVVAFIDSNPVLHGKQLAGKPIYAPQEVAAKLAGDVPILIGSVVNSASIHAAIRNQGVTNGIVSLEYPRIE